MADKLNDRHRKFADDYIMTGEKAYAYMREYPNVKKMETAAASATRVLKNDKVIAYIEERRKILDGEKIADMKEVKEFWTNTLRDKEAELRDRNKASEYIAKTNGAFIEKHEHSGNLNVEVKTTLIDKYLADK